MYLFHCEYRSEICYAWIQIFSYVHVYYHEQYGNMWKELLELFVAQMNATQFGNFIATIGKTSWICVWNTWDCTMSEFDNHLGVTIASVTLGYLAACINLLSALSFKYLRRRSDSASLLSFQLLVAVEVSSLINNNSVKKCKINKQLFGPSGKALRHQKAQLTTELNSSTQLPGMMRRQGEADSRPDDRIAVKKWQFCLETKKQQMKDTQRKNEITVNLEIGQISWNATNNSSRMPRKPWLSWMQIKVGNWRDSNKEIFETSTSRLMYITTFY